MPPYGRPAPDSAETEASLLARAQAGDVGAFERLSGAYTDRLFMLLVRLLGDRAEAEDVAQEVMVRGRPGSRSERGNWNCPPPRRRSPPGRPRAANCAGHWGRP